MAGLVVSGLLPGFGTSVAAAAPAIRISKIWSDQFPVVAANFLPAEPDTGKGPGDPRKEVGVKLVHLHINQENSANVLV